MKIINRQSIHIGIPSGWPHHISHILCWLVVWDMNFICPYFFIDWEESSQLTNSYFSRWLKPPTSYVLTMAHMMWILYGAWMLWWVYNWWRTGWWFSFRTFHSYIVKWLYAHVWGGLQITNHIGNLVWPLSSRALHAPPAIIFIHRGMHCLILGKLGSAGPILKPQQKAWCSKH